MSKLVVGGNSLKRYLSPRLLPLGVSHFSHFPLQAQGVSSFIIPTDLPEESLALRPSIHTDRAGPNVIVIAWGKAQRSLKLQWPPAFFTPCSVCLLSSHFQCQGVLAKLKCSYPRGKDGYFSEVTATRGPRCATVSRAGILLEGAQTVSISQVFTLPGLRNRRKHSNHF